MEKNKASSHDLYLPSNICIMRVPKGELMKGQKAYTKIMTTNGILDLGVVSSSLTLGAEIVKNKILKK